MRHFLRNTRLPTTPQIPGATWDYGIDLDWLKSMRDAWLNEYDWRTVERCMDTLNHFKVTIRYRFVLSPPQIRAGGLMVRQVCTFEHLSDN